MQPQNVFLQTFSRDLVTNRVRACDSFLETDIMARHQLHD